MKTQIEYSGGMKMELLLERNLSSEKEMLDLSWAQKKGEEL
ncbi:MAG: hypothetical protein AAF985_25360 [Bacteroidota bacterium]